MAKKSTAKKTSKPAKKAAPKAAKKVVRPVKKATPAKKAVKPAKKVAAKKPLAKSAAKPKPAKKIVAKAPVKKISSKLPAKRSSGSKIAIGVAAAASAAVGAGAAAIKAAKKDTGKNSQGKNLGMPQSKVNTSEVSPGGGIVLPATKSAPAMRLRADDAEILATAKERYGTKDLEQFRKLLLEQQREAREEFDILSQNILDTSGEFEADNQTYSLHTAEQGTDAIEREKTFLHAQRTSDYIKKLDEAIERIDRGTYGICVICGGLIEKGRLQAVPITQKHVDCKNRTNVRRPAESGQREFEEPVSNAE
jgi:DnaK suppressor protein